MERRKRKASRSTDCYSTHCCMIKWLTHCFFDSAWYSTGCSSLYLWPHYQRAAARPWQSNWCFGMWVEEHWAPPLGHGLVGAAHTPVAWIPNIQRGLLLGTMSYSTAGKSPVGPAGISKRPKHPTCWKNRIRSYLLHYLFLVCAIQPDVMTELVWL